MLSLFESYSQHNEFYEKWKGDSFLSKCYTNIKNFTYDKGCLESPIKYLKNDRFESKFRSSFYQVKTLKDKLTLNKISPQDDFDISEIKLINFLKFLSSNIDKKNLNYNTKRRIKRALAYAKNSEYFKKIYPRALKQVF